MLYCSYNVYGKNKGLEINKDRTIHIANKFSLVVLTVHLEEGRRPECSPDMSWLHFSSFSQLLAKVLQNTKNAVAFLFSSILGYSLFFLSGH